MIRGTANEEAVITALAQKPLIIAVFQCGMLSKKDVPWLACSPDGVALLDSAIISFDTGSGPSEGTVLASVEIKTCVAQSALERSLAMATSDLVFLGAKDPRLLLYVPKEHIGQVIQQRLVLSMNYAI